MAKTMGRKNILAKVAAAASDGIDPRDLSKLKTKANILTLQNTVSEYFVSEGVYIGSSNISASNKVITRKRD